MVGEIAARMRTGGGQIGSGFAAAILRAAQIRARPVGSAPWLSPGCRRIGLFRDRFLIAVIAVACMTHRLVSFPRSAQSLVRGFWRALSPLPSVCSENDRPPATLRSSASPRDASWSE